MSKAISGDNLEKEQKVVQEMGAEWLAERRRERAEETSKEAALDCLIGRSVERSKLITCLTIYDKIHVQSTTWSGLQKHICTINIALVVSPGGASSVSELGFIDRESPCCMGFYMQYIFPFVKHIRSEDSRVPGIVLRGNDFGLS